MDNKYIRNRITQLRIQKGVSEYRMSYDLGHSRSYINNISSGKVLPSMAEFLAICDYFEITPREFFDSALENPISNKQAIEAFRNLNESDMQLVLDFINRLLKNTSN